jgi:hypothetical protein
VGKNNKTSVTATASVQAVWKLSHSEYAAFRDGRKVPPRSIEISAKSNRCQQEPNDDEQQQSDDS